MKKLLLSILVATASCASASTLLLSSNAAGPTVFDTGNGTVVAAGLIRVGMLTDPANVNSFVEYGTSTIKPAGLGAGQKQGKVTGSVTNVTEADDAQFDNKDVYVWIYNAATAAASNQSGLFHAVGVKFVPDDPAGVGDQTTVFATALTEYVNTAAAHPGVQWTEGKADFSAAATDAFGTGRLVLGGQIPESSSMGLLALAGLALARRRR